MTEESEGSDVHPLLWRSRSITNTFSFVAPCVFLSVALTKLVQKLDKKSPSKSCLPTNYPSWAVDSSCGYTLSFK